MNPRADHPLLCLPEVHFHCITPHPPRRKENSADDKRRREEIGQWIFKDYAVLFGP